MRAGSLCGRRKKRREGEESAKEKRESNRPRFFSSSKSPAPLMPTLRALYESKKRKGFWSFRFLNRETLETRLGTTASLPLTSGDIQKKVCTSYTIMVAISQQTKGKERWRSFFAVQLVPSYTEFSRETVVRLALVECILWHSYLFHNPLRSILVDVFILYLSNFEHFLGWVGLFCVHCALFSSSSSY